MWRTILRLWVMTSMLTPRSSCNRFNKFRISPAPKHRVRSWARRQSAARVPSAMPWRWKCANACSWHADCREL
jgi:hypothetical protein